MSASQIYCIPGVDSFVLKAFHGSLIQKYLIYAENDEIW